MKSDRLRLYWKGMLSGAGLSLFAVYVLSQAIPINLEEWPRLAVGAIGLALLVAGFLLRPWRLSSASVSDAEPATRADRDYK